MLADNLSEVDVACTAISANTAAEQYIGVPERVNVVAADTWFPHDACVVVVVVVRLLFVNNVAFHLCTDGLW